MPKKTLEYLLAGAQEKNPQAPQIVQICGA